MRRHTVLVTAVLVLAGCTGITPREPAPLEGFSTAGSPAAYDSDTLFDYINGEAEVYISLGFVQLSRQSYRRDSTKALMAVDVYQMKDPTAARKTVERFRPEPTDDGPAVRSCNVGDQSYWDGYLLIVSSGPHFIRIMPDTAMDPKATASRDDAVELGKLFCETLVGGVK
jgi:hypothetical protein